MGWTPERPSEPGVYWASSGGKHAQADIVEVGASYYPREDITKPPVRVANSDVFIQWPCDSYLGGESPPWSDWDEWFGPLEPPP